MVMYLADVQRRFECNYYTNYKLSVRHERAKEYVDAMNDPDIDQKILKSIKNVWSILQKFDRFENVLSI